MITLLPNGIAHAKHIFSAVRRSPVPTHLTDRRDEGEVLFDLRFGQAGLVADRRGQSPSRGNIRVKKAQSAKIPIRLTVVASDTKTYAIRLRLDLKASEEPKRAKEKKGRYRR